MCCGQCVRLLISMYFMSIFGPAAVTAARPGLEPSSTGDPCHKFRADTVDRGWCACWMDKTHESMDLLHPSTGCKALPGAQDFALADADPACKCLSAEDKSKEQSSPVKVSALKFCSAILEATAFGGSVQELRSQRLQGRQHHFNSEITKKEKSKLHSDFIQGDLKVTTEVCRKVLTGTLISTSQKRKTRRSRGGPRDEDDSLFSDSNKLSEHESARGFGHLDSLMKGSARGHQRLLEHVCADECEQIVNETLNHIEEMVDEDVAQHAMPFEQSCADHVVRKVEAEVLGCCGRACGWNNQSCMAWPFFTPGEKVEWLDECCTEFNVLNGSSRDRMCNSVLTRQQAEKISKSDTKAKDDTDVGGAYIGQDPRLLWRQRGLKKFKEQLKHLDTMPKKGDLVSSDFLERFPDIRQKGLRHKWFKEEKITEKKQKSTSFVEMGFSTCKITFQSLKQKIHHCPPDMQKAVVKSCLRKEAGWQISDKPDDDELDDDLCMKKSPKVQRVATPDDCLRLDFGEIGIKRRFFIYENKAPAVAKDMNEVVGTTPIVCYVESDQYECPKFQPRDVTMNDFDRKNFDDYIYWIDEMKVSDRLEKIPQEAKTVNSAVGT